MSKRVAVDPGGWKCVAGEFKGGNLVAFEVEMTVPEISILHARLITAAPTMLEALKKLLAFEKFTTEQVRLLCSGLPTTPLEIACANAEAAIKLAEEG